MDGNDEARLRKLFDEVEVDPEERAAFLRGQCGDDERLRELVEEYLAAEGASAGTTAAARKPDGFVGQRIGPFTIRRILAAGPLSIVFAASKGSGNLVALKTMRFALSSDEARRRFEFESKAMVRLRHPHIARVYETGTWREPNAGKELAYFAMAFVEGAIPLRRFVAEHGMDARRMMPLFLDVCDAVGFGHQVGFVHRDLKSANVLVDQHGRVWVVDFGVASATDIDFIGVSAKARLAEEVRPLAHMAPEQLEGTPTQIDTRADVYALGVMLYELIAGEVPFVPGDRSPQEFAAVIRDTVPRGLGDGIDELARKALAADRDERYGSVAELAADLRRWLAHRPLSVGPRSGAYRARKFIRRHRGLVGLLLLGFVSLVGGMTAALIASAEARDAREVAERAAARASRIHAFLGTMFEGAGSKAPTVVDAIDALAARIGELRDDPEVEIAVRLMLSRAYRGQSVPARAQPHARRTLEMCREVYGSANSHVADALHELALVCAARGEQRAAVEYLREGMVVLRLAPGDYRARLARLRLAIGEHLLELGQVEEAHHEIVQAIEIGRELTGVEGLLARALTRLGDAQRRRGDVRRAFPSYREAIRLFESAGEADVAVAADAHYALAQNPEAGAFVVAHARRAVAILVAAHGEAARRTADARFTLAKALVERFEYAEAEKVLAAILPVYAAELEEPHAARIEVRRLLSLCLRSRDRATDAVPHARLAYAEGVSLHGARDTKSIPVANELGRALRDAGQLEESEEHFRRQEALRAADSDVSMAKIDIALVLGLRGDGEAALKLCREVEQAASGVIATSDPSWNLLRHARGRARLRSGQFEPAERELLGALASAQAAFGPGHPQIRAVLRDLVDLYEAWQRPETAATYRKRLVLR